jgi:hypothetical protein
METYEKTVDEKGLKIINIVPQKTEETILTPRMIKLNLEDLYRRKDFIALEIVKYEALLDKAVELEVIGSETK